MASEISLRVVNLSKRYRIGSRERQHDTLIGAGMALMRRPFENLRSLRSLSQFDSNGHDPIDVIWALKDVAFEVKKGEVVGVIGRNGAGKSTLLRILSRITYPTFGRVEIRGRVSSLLEVGTGFHPELTGRENVYLNGTVLGMTKAEVREKFDEIVDFAGIEKYIDTPVKRYSSGMGVRLAFAVAAHLEPEILLVDEVLAVGDAAFQKKCLGKMEAVAGEGRTVVFISHNMTAVAGLCSRAFLLVDGHLAAQGPTDGIISLYMEQVKSLSQLALVDRRDRRGNGLLRVTGVTLKNGEGQTVDQVRMGDDVVLELSYVSDCSRPLQHVQFSLHFYTMSDQPLFNLMNELVGDDLPTIPPNGTVRCVVPRWPLMPGQYSFNVFCQIGMDTADWILNARLLEVVEGDFFKTGRTVPAGSGDMFVLPHRWEACAP